MPGATFVDIWSISEAMLAVEPMVALPFLDVTMDFLAGVTANNFESGGIILIERATLSLFLEAENTDYQYKIRKI